MDIATALSTFRTAIDALEEFVETYDRLQNIGNKTVGNFHAALGDLLTELGRTAASLDDIRRHLDSLKNDGDFAKRYAEEYGYFRDFYFNQKNLKKARSHCSAIHRTARRLDFLASKYLQTDLDKWGEVTEAIKELTTDDDRFKEAYVRTVESLRTHLERLNPVVERNPQAAWKRFVGIRKQFVGSLGELTAIVRAMEDAQFLLRAGMGKGNSR